MGFMFRKNMKLLLANKHTHTLANKSINCNQSFSKYTYN